MKFQIQLRWTDHPKGPEHWQTMNGVFKTRQAARQRVRRGVPLLLDPGGRVMIRVNLLTVLIGITVAVTLAVYGIALDHLLAHTLAQLQAGLRS